LNENFGSEADLKQLISEAKSRDMGIMVDVVRLESRALHSQDEFGLADQEIIRCVVPNRSSTMSQRPVRVISFLTNRMDLSTRLDRTILSVGSMVSFEWDAEA
jgi:glycosidase